MTYVPRHPAKLAAVLAAACLLASGGSAGADSVGGAQYGPDGTGGAQYGAPLGEVGTPALHAIPQAMLGGVVQFHGTGTAGSTLTIQRLDPHTGQWVAAAMAQVDPDGNYTAVWRADHIGIQSIRAVPAGSEQARASSAADPISVTVYKSALVTWYGPGFYGHRTACGVLMSRDLLGVAHRGLPCGTKVALYYRGRTITVPVVDRGPYGVRKAAYDLTAATARALGVSQTTRIGAVSLHSVR
jgi:hypothetical protein